MSRSEFDLIERFVRAFPGPRPPLTLGPGDDCALLRPAPGEELALTTDALVEGVHFSSDFAPADIGHKALAVNLSDLAAMGAQPRAFLCAIAMPAERARDLAGIARGMAALARRTGARLAGGNFTRARELSITITALGGVPRGKALRRDGARAGHVLLVAGKLGGAAAGLRPGASRACLARQRRPEPLLALGQAARGLASAAIDVSDGLLQDLGHLARASGLEARVSARSVPIQAGATLEDALSGGEDYTLVLACPPRRVVALCEAGRRAGAHLTVVGQLQAGRAGRVRLLGAPAGLRGPGFDHFRTG